MIINFERARDLDVTQKDAYLDSILEKDQASARGVFGMVDHLQSVSEEELANRHLLEFSPLNFALTLRACQLRDVELHVIAFLERSVAHCSEREGKIAAHEGIDEATRTIHAIQASEYELVQSWWAARTVNDDAYEQSA